MCEFKFCLLGSDTT